MARNSPKTDQSQTNNQENEKPQPSSADSEPPSGQREDEEFVDIDHADLEMQDAEGGKRPSDDLELHRFTANPDDREEEDDSEEEHDHMANHPLLSMLTGRLGQRRRGSNHKWDALHPVTQVLSYANVDDCTELENSAFPEHERCSREKFEYRLARCPELSLGLFSRPTQAESQGQEKPPKRTLIAHVIATRTPSPSVTDATMALPSNWRARKSSLPDAGPEEPLGHRDEGSTICIHSLAVVKEHQGIGLGSILLKAYIQRIKDSKIAERLALLAHDHLVEFYTGMGFQNMGRSAVTFGGGNWNNMVLEFTNEEDD